MKGRDVAPVPATDLSASLLQSCSLRKVQRRASNETYLLRHIISAEVDGSGGGGGVLVFFAVPLDVGGALELLPFAAASTCALFFFLAMLPKTIKSPPIGYDRVDVGCSASCRVRIISVPSAGSVGPFVHTSFGG